MQNVLSFIKYQFRYGISPRSLRTLACSLISFLFIHSQAHAFTYRGIAYQADGVTPLAEKVNFTFSIYDPSRNCLLYQEKQSNITLPSTGVFSRTVATSTPSSTRRDKPTDPGLSIAAVFATSGVVRPPGSTHCTPGYTAAPGNLLYMRTQIYRVTSGQTITLTPDTALDPIKKSILVSPTPSPTPTTTSVSCPTNYVRVPAKAPYTSTDFCVAKFEAKKSGSTAISQAINTPWVNITQPAAITACQANGAEYDLISNAEWQTLAQNIEIVTTNWSSGTVGSGSINRGHSDNSPANSLAAGTTDTDACNGTGQTCSNTSWDTQRRTHVLSNGQVIWDVAGNMWEWVKDTNSISFDTSASMSQVTTSSHTTTGTIGTLTGAAKLLFGPSGNYTALNSGEYGGLGKGWLNYSAGAVYRGGDWVNGVSTGVFSVSLTHAASSPSAYIGFRCVYRPHTPSATPSPRPSSTASPTPSYPLSLVSPSSARSNNRTPIIQVGGLTSGATVGLYLDRACSNSTLKATGTASGTTLNLTSSTLPTDAVYAFYAKVTLPSGSSLCSPAVLAYTLDTVAPATPTKLTLVSPSASRSNDKTPTIQVTGLSAGNTIRLFTDSSCSSATLKASDTATGSFLNLTSAELTTDGAYTFYANSTDRAGNVSNCSTAYLTYTLDTVAPTAPSSLTLTLPSSNLSNNRTPTIQVEGVTSGDQISLHTDSSCSSTSMRASARATGTSLNLVSTPLTTDSTYTFYARATNSAGNFTCSSVSLTYTLETSLPSIPTSLSFVSPSSSPSNNHTPTIRVSGLTAGSIVSLHTDKSCRSASQKASGTATQATLDLTSSPLATDDSYTFYPKVITAAGNSICSATGLTYVLDTVAPALPTKLTLAAPTSTVSKQRTPTIQIGPTTIGDTIHLYTSNNCSSDSLRASGIASGVSINLTSSSISTDGVYHFYAKSTDRAGNSTSCSVASVTYTLETVAPTPPSSLTLLQPSSNPSNKRTPTITVAGLTSGDRISLHTDSACSISTQRAFVTATSSTMNLTSTSLTTDGTYTFYARAADRIGNASCSSAHLDYTLDTAVPTSTGTMSLISPTSSPSNDRTPTIRISGVSAGVSAALYTDKSCSLASQRATGIATQSSVDLTTTQLTMDTTYTFYSKITTPAGNSACSATGLAYTLDTRAPLAPSQLTLITPSAAYSTLRTPTIQVSGLISGNSVSIHSDSDCSSASIRASATATEATLNLTLAPLSTDGAYQFYAKTTDVAGNSSCSIAKLNYRLDTTPPTAPTSLILVSPTSSPSKNRNPIIQVSGVSARDSISLHNDNVCTTTSQKAVSVSTGTIINLSSSTLPYNGPYTFYAKATDPAGNSTCSSAKLTYIVNSTTASPRPSPAASPAISIASNATHTTTTSTNLTLGAIGATEMYVTNASGCASGGTWEAYSTSKSPWILGQTNGTATVYVKFRNASFDESSCISDTIIHDNTPPTAPSSLTLVTPATSPGSSTTPTIQVSGLSSGDTIMLYTDNACATTARATGTATGTTLHLTSSTLSADTAYTFYAKATDPAGNTSSCSTAHVAYTLDTSAPTSTSISIAAGATYTKTSSVSLTLGATGATQMYITNTAGCSSGGSWESYATSKAGWTLAQTNASATIYVKFRDAAFNESSCISDTIIHDTVAPSTPASIVNGTSEDLSKSPNLTWAASTDSGSGMGSYEVAIGTTAGGSDVIDWTDVGNVVSTQFTNQNFVSGTTYYASVRAKDQAGNTSSVRTGNGWTVVTASTATVTAFDPYVSNRVLLLKGEGLNGTQNNTFVDSSSNNFAINNIGTPTQGTFSPFSAEPGKWGTSLNSGNFQISDTDGGLTFGNGDFTIEFWIYNTKSNGPIFYWDQRQNDNSNVSLMITPGGVNYGDVNLILSHTNIAATYQNQWVHYALTRAGNVWRAFANGKLLASNPNFSANISGGTTRLFARWDSGYNYYPTGTVSNFRVVKGTAVYTSEFSVPTSPVTNISGTTLLAFNNNRFVDSASNRGITVNGDVRVIPSSPFAPTTTTDYSTSIHGGSAYFNGTSDYLTLSSRPEFGFDGPFTIEFWYNKTGNATNGYDVALGVGNGSAVNGWFIEVSTTRPPRFYSPQGYVYLSNSDQVNDGSWHHFAVVRTSATGTNNTTIYRDGKSVGTGTVTGTVNYTGSDLRVGGLGYFSGYLSNVRIQKGTAAYTTNFTPPTQPVLATATTTALLNFTNGGIIDSTKNNDFTTVSTAKTSTSLAKYGTGSLAFNGTSDYLSTYYSNPQLTLGTGDFTIEAWAYSTSRSTYRGLFHLSTTPGGIAGSPSTGLAILSNTPTGTLQVYAGGTNYSATTTAIPLNTWTHLALVRSSGVTKLYMNGNLVTDIFTSGSLTDSFNYTASYIAVGGAYSTSYVWQGNIDNFSIVKGKALYTSNFTPGPIPGYNTKTSGFAACPANYVLVPALSGYTSSDFCVAKYEAKANGSVAVSQALGTPWASITQPAAITACQANGGGYDLISNAEWQTVARNIEGVPQNWWLSTRSPFRFTYTNGSDQSFIVPAGCNTITAKVWGAGGSGGSHWHSPWSGPGGTGAAGSYVMHVFAVTPGSTLTVTVGGADAKAQAIGRGGVAVINPSYTYGERGGSGGGASFIRSGATILVAAAGGGGAARGFADYGGGNGINGDVSGSGTLTQKEGLGVENYGSGGGGYFGGRAGSSGDCGWSGVCEGGYGGSSYGMRILPGSGSAAPNTSDPDYVTGIAVGGASSPAGSSYPGGDGLVVLSCEGGNNSVVDLGSINRGHSDNVPASALAADASDVNACAGTGQTCSNTVWDTQRRTHVLSNGQVIWDFAGNVWEWVKDTNSTNFGANSSMSQVTSTTNTTSGTVGSLTGTAKFLFGSFGNYTALNSGEYGGLGYGWLNYTSGGVLRGGDWSNGVNTGVFSVYLAIATSYTAPGTGFRCTYHPTHQLALTAPTQSITSSNQSTYTLSGTCAQNGTNNIMIYAGTDLVATTSCANGTYTTPVDLSKITDGTLNLTVQLKTADGDTYVSNAASVIKDATLPTAPSPMDDGTSSSSTTSSPLFSWAPSTDTGTGLSYYEVAIGTSAGGTEIQTWTNVGTGTTKQMTSLNLINGTTYYASVRARDKAGNISSVAQGNGWTVNTGLDAGTSATQDSNAIYRSLLLSGEGIHGSQNNTFLDSSNNNFTITRNGTPTQGTFSPFSAEPGKWGCSFGGADKFTIASDPAFALGTSNFTLEGWFYRDDWATTGGGLFSTGTTDAFALTHGSNTLRFYYQMSSAFWVVNTTNFNTTGWNHIAVVRSGNTITAFVNGISVGSTTTTGSFAQGNVVIGADNGFNFYKGMMSNVRLVKGTALYSSNFTPSTTPLTAIEGTSLLICQDNRFKDNSTNNFTLTPTGTPKVVASSPFIPTTTTYSPSVHGGSIYLDGSSALRIAANNKFSFEGAFTIEFWYFGTGTTNYGMPLSTEVNGWADNGWWVEMGQARTPNFYYNRGTMLTYSNTSQVADGSWHHVAIVRTSATGTNNTTAYVDGVASGTATMTGTVPATTDLLIGGVTRWIGYLSDVRIVKDAAVYTGRFNPPTSPLTTSGANFSSANVSLLLNFTNGGIIDSTKNNDFTTVSTAKISTTQTKYGAGSLAFNGTSDYLSTYYSNPQLTLGTGDFTVEGWVYSTSRSTTRGIFHLSATSGGLVANTSTGLALLTNTGDGRLNVYAGGITSGMNTTSSTIPLNTWTHFALVRSSGITKLYMNGNLVTDIFTAGSLTDTFNYTASYIAVGAAYSTSNLWQGNIDNFTIVKGKALYTSNFTPGPISGFNAKFKGFDACPPNYVLVPALSGYTTSDFCVAKYEAKASGSVAVSLDSGTPWVSITQPASITACQANGPNYDLISNAEWQSVARNIEGVSTNWSSGVVGSGSINRGHSDNAPAGPLAADASDTNACSGTGQTCSSTVWDTQRRTHVLSNGQVIWDVAGNVWEWVKDTNSTNFGANAYISQVTTSSHTTTGTIGTLTGATKLLFGPSGNYTVLNSGEYGGLGYGWLNYTTNAILRGGNWVNGAQMGIFATYRQFSDTSTDASTGFRCTYHPTHQLALTAPTQSITSSNQSAYTLSGTCTQNGTDNLQFYSGTNFIGTGDCVSGAFSTSLDLSSIVNATLTLSAEMITSDGNTYLSNTVTVIKDTIAPTTPGSVNDGISSSSTSISTALSWTASTDSESGLANYEVAIGTTAGGTETQTWTNVGTVTSIQLTSLNLTEGTTYYSSVRARDKAGNLSSVATGDGWIATNSTSRSLLLTGEGTNTTQNNTFIDSSSNNFTITRNGTPTQGTFSPFSAEPGKWGCSFDGSSYLSIPHSSSLDLTSGNFTIELWAYPTSFSVLQTLLEKDWYPGITNSQYTLEVTTAGKINVRLGYGNASGTQDATGNQILKLNSWNHIALVRSSSTVTLFVNGVNDISYTQTITMTSGSRPILIGAGASTSPRQYFSGSISNVRITKDSALYTSTFTPSTAALTAVTGTSLLTCQDNLLKDNSTNNFTVTPTGTIKAIPSSPFAPSTTTYSPSVHGGSGYFNPSTTSSYLSIANGTSAFPLNTETNWTLETWAYISSYTVHAWGTATTIAMISNFFSLDLLPSGEISLVTNVTGGSWQNVYRSSGAGLGTNQWNHIALTRSGNALSMYANGKLVYYNAAAIFTHGGTDTMAYLATYGTSGYGLLNGYLSNLRFSKSLIYSTNFTPPTLPVTSSATDSLLLKFTNAGVIDSTQKNDLTTVGNAQISTTQKKYGSSSLYFNGISDYLTLPYSNDLQFTGDFTIETWVYPVSKTTTTPAIISNYSTWTTNGSLSIFAGHASANTSKFNVAINGTFPAIQSTADIKYNAWQHLALARSGSSITFYVDGVAQGTYTSTATIQGTSNNWWIGTAGDAVTTGYFNGYIDNLSVIKGKALYTSNFTPATIHGYISATPTKITINNPVTPPLTTAWINNSTKNAYTLTGTCAEAGSNNIKIFSDSTLLSTTSCSAGTFTATVDLSALFDGSVRLSAVFTDSLGNTYNSGITSLTKDTSAPTSTSITWPLSGMTITALNQYAIYVIGSCSEDGAGNVTLKAGTTSVGYPMSCTNSIFSGTFDFSSVADGNFNLTVVLSDSAGNTVTSSPLSFAKDTLAPTLGSISIAGGAAATNTTTVSLTLSAVGTPVQMYITNTAGCASGGAWEDYATTKGAWTLAQTNATATVYVKYRDAAYNESGCSGDTIIHDTVAPTAPTAVNDGSTSTATASPTLSWTASTDASSGISYYEVAIGTTTGATDYMTWTNVGSSATTQITGQNFTQGSTYFASVRARDQAGNISAVGQGDGWTVSVDACPSGYILVPPLAGYTDSSFCVAKYEAKSSGSIAVSQANGTPWASITQPAAITACQANGANYDLITNAEWQTLARNIELVPANWSTGTVGSGSINRGHSDNTPANSLAADISDSNSCSGTGQTCTNTVWDTQRRTHVLSNGQVVWDVAGNILEWIKDTNSTNFGTDAYLSQVTTSSHTITGTIGALTGAAKFLFGPSGSYTALNTGEYGGLGHGWIGYASGNILRGGSFNLVNSGHPAGVFSVRLDWSNGTANPTIGFRCVYHPPNTNYSSYIGIVQNGTSRNWADGNYATSCNEYKNPPPGYSYTGASGSATYTIKPGSSTMNVYCDMNTSTALGWTLFAAFSSSTNTTLALGTSRADYSGAWYGGLTITGSHPVAVKAGRTSNADEFYTLGNMNIAPTADLTLTSGNKSLWIGVTTSLCGYQTGLTNNFQFDFSSYDTVLGITPQTGCSTQPQLMFLSSGRTASGCAGSNQIVPDVAYPCGSFGNLGAWFELYAL